MLTRPLSVLHNLLKYGWTVTAPAMRVLQPLYLLLTVAYFPYGIEDVQFILFSCTLWQPVLLEPSMFRLVSFHASLSLWNLRCLGWYLIICWLVLEPTTIRLIADSFMQAILFSGTYDIYADILLFHENVSLPEPTMFRLISYYFMQAYSSGTYDG